MSKKAQHLLVTFKADKNEIFALKVTNKWLMSKKAQHLIFIIFVILTSS